MTFFEGKIAVYSEFFLFSIRSGRSLIVLLSVRSLTLGVMQKVKCEM